jgi:hypothetical protein
MVHAALAAPAGVAEAAEDRPAGGRRAWRVLRAGPAVPWEVVFCGMRGTEAGQYKFEAALGLRDGPSWFMRTKTLDRAWPTCGPRFRTGRTSVVGETPDFVQRWCQTNRTCCPEN